MSTPSTRNVFEQIFDVIVYGGGYAGFGAAMSLSEAGQSVLLIDSYGDLLWESGRCFVPSAGQDIKDDSCFSKLLDDLKKRNGFDGDFLDGGMAEVSATCMLEDSNVQALYYVHPVAVEKQDGMIQAIILATKSGKRRVVARQFVDASEKGQLLKLAGFDRTIRKPNRNELYMYLQHQNWPADANGKQTYWPTQRLFASQVNANQTLRQAIEAAIEALSDTEKQGVLSHVSYEPYPIYDAISSSSKSQANLAVASPACVADAIITPADRHCLGIAAAHSLAGLSTVDVDQSIFDTDIAAIKPSRDISTDVLIVGVGTGGAIAAIAAGDQGASVIAIDPFTFPGGIGTGGGIHAYYYGVPGGLQDTIDTQTKNMMKAYGDVLVSHQYNAVAKMIVLEKHFARTNVNFISHSLLCDVTTENGLITSVLVATQEGPIRITAKAYIDGTGDGDLAALAGASFEMGRDGDGLPHAYSQPTGNLQVREHSLRSGSRNFDSGWCDPTDPQDFTRARITGIVQQQLDQATNEQRVTYVCPAIGLRQARQIITDKMVQLDDLVTGKFCDDVIGYAGSNYDAHTADYPLESDEGVFWVCATRSWYTGFVTPIPYRCLIPKGLKNIWIASRCLGISQDAHYAIRMMRDMQRIGEASGYAAADYATSNLVDSRDVVMKKLQDKLKATQALTDDMTVYGSGWYKSACLEMNARDASKFIEQDPRVVGALENLRVGKADGYFWMLMKNRDQFEAAVMAVLNDSSHAKAKWFAAGIAAMWGKIEAQTVLIDAIKNRQFGYETRGVASGPREQHDPLLTARFTQDWLTAVCLLRVCGDDDCLDTLDDLLASHTPTLLTAVSVLWTLERLVTSKRVTNLTTVKQIVSRIAVAKVSDQYLIPQACVTGLADVALNGWDGKEPAPCHQPRPWPYRNTGEDHSWQLTLMLAKVAAAVGMDMPDDLEKQLGTDRLLVREALGKFSQQSVLVSP